MARTAIPAALLLTVAACGSATVDKPPAPNPPPVSAQQLSTVVLRVGDQKGNSKTQLAAAGLLDNLPYKIEWSTFTSGPPLLEAVAANAVDVGSVGNTPPLFAAASNADLSMVAASKEDPRSDVLAVPPDSPLRTVDDLRGKTIAVAQGSSAHGQVLNTLAAAKISLQDVKLAFMQPADALSAFKQRQVDAWAIWDPYTSQAELDAGARIIATGEQTANGLNFEVASRKALADAAKNTAIRDYVTRLARARLSNVAHPQQRAQAWSSETGLPLAVTERAVERRADHPVPLDASVVASEQQLADSFADVKVLPTRFRVSDFVDHRYDADLAAVR